jgi:PAS domain S-box-containing protein
MIWMSATDKLCTYVNQSWLDFTGRPLEAQLGNGWAESVHPQDLQDCMDTYTQAFDRRASYKMEYRAKRNDGEYRWILDVGVPRFNKDASFAGYIGSCLDITDRKLAEEALGSVSHKLIEAQEKERTRIARELHDDINQRIALATVELDHLKQSTPGLDDELRTRMSALGVRLQETGIEVQAISHRLHSSKLELLGVVAACRSFCQEVAKQHNVKVEFSSEGMPKAVQQDASLCLFRVLQESLQNAIKYSGAKRFEVQLRGTSDELQLTVRDDGIGFDVDAALRNHGLGLISMRERASLVKGTIAITSRPMGGTVVTLRVPIAVNRTSQAISGAA